MNSKLMMNNLASFSTPVHEGKMIPWHLSSIIAWVKEGNRYQIDEQLQEIAGTNMHLNIAKETTHMDSSVQKQLLVGIS